MAWRSFNLLMDKPRVLVLDTRSSASYAAGHIRGSVCIRLDPELGHKQSLSYVAGPGPPTWYPNCWWDRDVLLVLPPLLRSTRKRKKAIASSSLHPVFTFLKEEGLVRSIHVLENDDSDDGEDEAFAVFAREYPFIITKSTKSSEIKNHPTEVVPGLLYLGDLTHATDQSCLKNLHISHVLTIHTEPLQLPKSFMHTFFELEDSSSADIGQYFEPTYEIVEKAKKDKGRVLIHCGAGVSRSATLCAAYLMRVNYWCVQDALKFLREQRSKVNPNPGFLSALHEYSAASGFNPAILKSTAVPTLDRTIFLHLDIMKDGQCIGNIPFNKNKISFGRGEDCNVILDHASISRHHAFLMNVPEQEKDSPPCSTVFQLVDNSTHGTFVNGAKILKNVARTLRFGDVIEFGASSRMYIYCDNISCSMGGVSLEGMKKLQCKTVSALE